MPYLLMPNRELALRLFVVLRKGLKLLDWFRLRNRHAKLDILFGILVSGLHYVSVS